MGKAAKLGTGGRRCAKCGVREDATFVGSKCCAATPANGLHTFASGFSKLVQYLRTLMQSTQVRQKRRNIRALTPRELEIREKERAERLAALALLDPPRDVHDQAGWDRYWHHRKGFHYEYCPALGYFLSSREGGRLTEPEREVQQLLAEGKSVEEIASVLNLTQDTVASHKKGIMDLLHAEGGDFLLIQCLIKRGAKTVLCAGNGVSQEPRALAAAGFDATAMDLSPLAVHLAETWQFSSEELDSFCTKEQRTPGGTVRFVIGDVLDRSVCPGPFDAIIERRMLQLFPEQELGAALDSLASRLQPNGLFMSHLHNVGQNERFFRDRGWLIAQSPERASHAGRVVLFLWTSG